MDQHRPRDTGQRQRQDKEQKVSKQPARIPLGVQNTRTTVYLTVNVLCPFNKIPNLQQ